MPKRGTPKSPEWHWRDVIRVRQYADRGFSAKEASILISALTGVTRTRAAVSFLASRLGIHFHGTATGAPMYNNNRRIGEAKKATQRIINGDC